MPHIPLKCYQFKSIYLFKNFLCDYFDFWLLSWALVNQDLIICSFIQGTFHAKTINSHGHDWYGGWGYQVNWHLSWLILLHIWMPICSNCFIHDIDYLLYLPVIYFFPILAMESVIYTKHASKPVQNLHQKETMS